MCVVCNTLVAGRKAEAHTLLAQSLIGETSD